MKDLVTVIVSNLVHNPEKIDIKEIETDEMITYEIRVSDEDIGRIIGKQGRIIKAIRTVVKASSVNFNKRVNVEIISE